MSTTEEEAIATLRLLQEYRQQRITAQLDAILFELQVMNGSLNDFGEEGREAHRGLINVLGKAVKSLEDRLDAMS